MAHTTQSSFARFQRVDPGPILDDPDLERDVEMVESEQPTKISSDRLIIAVDFGTTFSSVAYARFDEKTPREALGLADIHCIKNYPDDRVSSENAWKPRQDVPTELWYNLDSSWKPRQRQSADTTMHVSLEGADHDEFTASDSSSEASTAVSGDENESESESDRQPAQKGRERNSSLFWGFGVHKHLRKIDIPKDGTRRLSRFKLVLDEREETNDIRTEIAPILRNLKRSKLIKQDTDVICDYLEQLLNHTLKELRKSNIYDETITTEFAMCVPAAWPSKACRIMQVAMAEASQKTGLGNSTNGSLNNLYIISEPEAAAACVLAEDKNDIYVNETIVVLDAGGGTIDAVTYQVTNSYPLRLEAEVVQPGSICPSPIGYINERYERLLLKRLKHEQYLVKNGKTIKSIAEGKTTEFENGEKREIDTTERFNVEPVWIDDLRPNPERKLFQNRLTISRRDMSKVFEPSLQEAADLLTEQLEMAKAKEYSVQKVVLIGGFGKSPSLRSRVKEVLATEKNFLGQQIDFLTPDAPATTVARGAVLGAFNKDYGLRRITQCSYGFLRTEPYEPSIYPAHQKARCIIDKADGEKYIDGTIDWFIQRGEELPQNHQYPNIVKHTFPLNRKKLICKEELYVSDKQQEPHYRKKHAMNKGAEFAGSITADMTWLKDQQLIQPQPPSEFSTFSGPRAQELHWSVEWELVLMIDGRNLRYEARWPASRDVERTGQAQRVHAQGQTCIAAAFKPGTA